jgi:hypothetical protein
VEEDGNNHNQHRTTDNEHHDMNHDRTIQQTNGACKAHGFFIDEVSSDRFEAAVEFATGSDCAALAAAYEDCSVDARTPALSLGLVYDCQ